MTMTAPANHQDGLREVIARLRIRDRDFVRAYAAFRLENPNARDRDFAEHFGCTRRTIVNRRKRLRSLGVPLYRMAPPGFDPNQNRMPCCRCPTCGQRVKGRRSEVGGGT